MGWKKLPYWLKGGIITGILYLISYSILPLPQVLHFLTPFTSVGEIHLWLINILSKIINYEDSGLKLLLTAAWLGLFLDFLVWILIGVIIGWIIGKIKSKK